MHRIYLLLFAVLGLPGVGLAMECQSDDDCAEHYYCSQVDFAAPCSIDSDGNEECPDPPEAEPGECVPGPISCENDADCPGISTCMEEVSINSNDCAAEEGEEPCEPEQVEEVIRTCGFELPECGMDGECPAGFVCEQIEIPCAPRTTIACAEGEDCPEPEQPDCPEETQGVCVFEPVPCESDDVCMDGWSCETIDVTSCSSDGAVPADAAASMGSSGSSQGAPAREPAPEPDQGDEDGEEDAPAADIPEDPMNAQGEGVELEVEDSDDDCETVTQQLCLPDGYEHYMGGPGGADSLSEAAASGDATDGDLANSGELASPEGTAESSDSDDDGCACSATSTNPQPLFGLFLLLLAARVWRRRHL